MRENYQINKLILSSLFNELKFIKYFNKWRPNKKIRLMLSTQLGSIDQLDEEQLEGSMKIGCDFLLIFRLFGFIENQ